MKHLLITLFLFAVVPTFAQSFEPGLWTSKESLTLNNIPMPSSKGEECITASQAKDAKGTIEKELKKKGCSLTKWVIKDKKLNADIKCNNEDMEATGNLHGPFSSKSYELTGEAKGKYKKALPAFAELKLSGQWTKACKK